VIVLTYEVDELRGMALLLIFHPNSVFTISLKNWGGITLLNDLRVRHETAESWSKYQLPTRYHLRRPHGMSCQGDLEFNDVSECGVPFTGEAINGSSSSD
jgi:hypothetical protein